MFVYCELCNFFMNKVFKFEDTFLKKYNFITTCRRMLMNMSTMN